MRRFSRVVLGQSLLSLLTSLVLGLLFVNLLQYGPSSQRYSSGFVNGKQMTDIQPTGLEFTVNKSASEPSSVQRYALTQH